MATNTINIAAERPVAEEIFRLQRLDGEGLKNGKEHSAAIESSDGLALAPLVDKIAYGIARGLVIAMKELENHIASETRKVGDSVGRRLDAIQSSVQDLAVSASEQRIFNISIQERCQELASGAESLKEADARQEAGLASLRDETKELATSVSTRIDAATATLTEADARQNVEMEAVFASLRNETKELAASVSERIDAATASLTEADARQNVELESLRAATQEMAEAMSARIDAFCRDLSVQQEDIAAVKSTLSRYATTVEGLVGRLDRQADTLRTMCAAYAQRETELGSLVDGLARLRAYPAPTPIDRL
jgi:chromosome segregation ATPase